MQEPSAVFSDGARLPPAGAPLKGCEPGAADEDDDDCGGKTDAPAPSVPPPVREKANTNSRYLLNNDFVTAEKCGKGRRRGGLSAFFRHFPL